MSFVFASFLRRAGEGLLQFDNRISHMLPVLSGMVFFDMQNYVRESGEFRVYIEWNAELSGMLQDRLPSGGYFVKATMEQAEELDKQTDGIPVYMKLIAKEGRLYPYRTYVMWNGRPFSVEFNGNRLIPVDYRAKAEGQKEEIKGTERQKTSDSLYEWFRSSERRVYGGSQRFLYGQAGSRSFWQLYSGWRSGSERGYLSGSYRAFSLGSGRGFFPGSSRGYYALLGSGGLYEWFRSSQKRAYVGSSRGFLLGSSGGFFPGSNRGFLSGSNSGFFSGSGRGYLSGSSRGFLGGSSLGYIFGSQRFLYGMNGSRSVLFGTNGSRSVCRPSVRTNNEPPYWRFLPLEWQLINRSKRPHSCKKGGNGMFGYGLDLIDG